MCIQSTMVSHVIGMQTERKGAPQVPAENRSQGIRTSPWRAGMAGKGKRLHSNKQISSRTGLL